VGASKLNHLHRPARPLQRALGDVRGLKRFASLAGTSPHAERGKRKKHSPGYRHQREKLHGAAIAAYRDLKAEAC